MSTLHERQLLRASSKLCCRPPAPTVHECRRNHDSMPSSGDFKRLLGVLLAGLVRVGPDKQANEKEGRVATRHLLVSSSPSGNATVLATPQIEVLRGPREPVSRSGPSSFVGLPVPLFSAHPNEAVARRCRVRRPSCVGPSTRVLPPLRSGAERARRVDVSSRGASGAGAASRALSSDQSID